MFEIVNVAGAAPQKLIESALGRTTPYGETDVPLAKASRPIPLLLEVLWQDPFAMGQSDPVPILCGR